VDVEQAGAGQDRRVFRRVPVVVPCRIANAMFGLESEATTVNISMDGMGLLAPVNWSESSRIRIQLAPAGFETEGVIVYRKGETPGYRYGVRFAGTKISQIFKLRRFLKQHHSGKLSL
jgi:hypothetical protein